MFLFCFFFPVHITVAWTRFQWALSLFFLMIIALFLKLCSFWDPNWIVKFSDSSVSKNCIFLNCSWESDILVMIFERLFYILLSMQRTPELFILTLYSSKAIKLHLLFLLCFWNSWRNVERPWYHANLNTVCGRNSLFQRECSFIFYL